MLTHFTCKKAARYSFLGVLVLFVSACGSLWVVEEKDSGPDRPMDVSHISEPTPRAELRTIAGNKTPYQVLGKTYHVLATPEGYKEKGVASWYGKKFHGRRTSNGEIYDMYGMTAAHKTLPIPSYVRVTNVTNFRSIIVRVNDRGPFHGDRLIDLTYTAAKKLGFERSGTAKVSIEYIDPSTYRSSSTVSGNGPVSGSGSAAASSSPKAPTPTNSAGYALPKNTYLQVGAFSRKAAAASVQAKLKKLTSLAVVVTSPATRPKLYKVRVGPFDDNFQMQSFRKALIKENYPTPHVVYH